MIRAIPSNASDNVYCTLLAHSAIHGAMAGYCGFTVGPVNNRHCYIPISVSSLQEFLWWLRCVFNAVKKSTQRILQGTSVHSENFLDIKWLLLVWWFLTTDAQVFSRGFTFWDSPYTSFPTDSLHGFFSPSGREWQQHSDRWILQTACGLVSYHQQTSLTFCAIISICSNYVSKMLWSKLWNQSNMSLLQTPTLHHLLHHPQL